MNVRRHRARLSVALLAVGLGITALARSQGDHPSYDTQRFVRDGFMGADYLEVNRIYPARYLGLMSKVETLYAINHMSPERATIHGVDVEAGKRKLEADCAPTREITRYISEGDTRVKLEFLEPRKMGCLERNG